MFAKIFPIFVLIGATWGAVVNIPNIIQGVIKVAPIFVKLDEGIENGRYAMAHGTSFSAMMDTLQQNIDLIGAGYIGNAIQLRYLAKLFQSGSGNQAGSVVIPDSLLNTITTSINSIANGWATVYKVNAKIGQIVLDNQDLLADTNNLLPRSIALQFTSTEQPMVQGFADMAASSKALADAIKQLGNYVSAEHVEIVNILAKTFDSNASTYAAASIVLNDTNQRILNLNPANVGNFLGTFNEELTELSQPYEDLVNAAISLNDVVNELS